MPATYEPIATTTLSSSAATIVFSSLSSSYTDIRLVITGIDTTGSYPSIRFNSDTATNYSLTTLRGSGSAASSSRNTSITRMYLATQEAWNTVTPSFCSADIFSYAGSTNKTALITTSTDRNGSGSVERIVGLWRSTSAITSITILLDGGSFATGTTATLYGILKA